MNNIPQRRRDYFAGGLMALIGLLAIFGGGQYDVGTLRRMGPGYFPVALGIILASIGILIAASAGMSRDGKDADALVGWPDPRGALCIVVGVVSFVVLGKYAGLIAAIFSAVFIAALGDRSGTIKSSLLLAASVTVVGVLLFSYGLQVQFPLVVR